MARAIDGSANDQGCSGCTRQQDRPDGLGTDDQRRALQGAGHRIERDKARDRRRGWKGRTGANAQSRLIPPDRENPVGPCTSSASFRSGPEPREWHYRRASEAAPTGRIHGRTDRQLQNARVVANGEPSIHGPFLTLVRCSLARAFCPLRERRSPNAWHKPKPDTPGVVSITIEFGLEQRIFPACSEDQNRTHPSRRQKRPP